MAGKLIAKEAGDMGSACKNVGPERRGTVRASLGLAIFMTTTVLIGCGDGMPASSSSTVEVTSALSSGPGWYGSTPSVAAARNLNSTNTWENTVLTIPPNAAGCGPYGAVFVGHNPYLQKNTLTCQIDGTHCNPKTIDFNTVACEATVSPKIYISPPGYDDRPCETSDHNIIRAPNGHILFNLGVVRHQPTSSDPRRGMHVFMDSADCGATWTVKKRFDPVEIGLLDSDHGLIYGDPWSSSVYFTVQDANGSSYLFRSTDGGATWTPQINATGALPKAGDGWKLTTLQNQVVFLLGCPDATARPTVVRWDPIAQQAQTNLLPGTCQTLSALGIEGSANITRIGAYLDGEYIRVMWPELENGQQVLRTMSLFYGLDHSPSQGPITTLRASSSTGSLFSVTSIEADRFELDPLSSASVAFVHWYETTTTPSSGTNFGNIFAKGAAVRDRDNWSDTFTLSSASWPVFAKPGDYARSGFWYDSSKHQFNFLPHWAESATAGSSVRRAAVVSINKEQSFTTFESLGGTSTVAPSVSSPSAGQLDVYARGTENDIWHKSKVGTSPWSGWEDLAAPPGGANGSPASVAWGPGRDDIFVLGTNSHLWHKSYDSSYGWSGWEDLGGPFSSDPSVTSWGPGHVDLFIRGTDNSIMHESYDNAYGYTGWHSLGGSSIAAPASSSWKDSGSSTGRVDVFGVGGDNVLWQKTCTGTCKAASDFPSSWTSIGGNFVTGAAAAAFSANRIDVFGRGADLRIYHNAWDSLGGWSGWLSVPGSGSSANRPAVATRQPNMDLFELGPDNSIWHAGALP